MPEPSPQFYLSPDDQAGRWRGELERNAALAARRVEKHLGFGLDEPPLIRSIAPEKAFYDELGMRPHNLMAVAQAEENLVLINRAAFIAAGRSAQVDTLAHEFTHLVVGRRVPGGVPRWLNEGLAMIVETDGGHGYHTRIMVAATFGGLQPLDSLWSGLTAVDQELAYAESLSATRFLLETQFGDSDDPEPLLRKLADREEGEHLRAMLRDPLYVRSFERRWRQSLRSVWSIIGALSGSGILWGALGLALAVAYWRKRRMNKLREAEWRRQEEEDDDGRRYEDEPEDTPYLDEEDERW